MLMIQLSFRLCTPTSWLSYCHLDRLRHYYWWQVVDCGSTIDDKLSIVALLLMTSCRLWHCYWWQVVDCGTTIDDKSFIRHIDEHYSCPWPPCPVSMSNANFCFNCMSITGIPLRITLTLHMKEGLVDHYPLLPSLVTLTFNIPDFPELRVKVNAYTHWKVL